MSEALISCIPIGVIRSEHVAAGTTPIQPIYARGCKGQAEAVRLTVKPFLQDVERGIFATRAPCRPNAIGLGVVELVRCEGNVLHLDGVDILDGTPLLDIKPYMAKFDRIESSRNGWQDDVDEETARRRGRPGFAGEITS